MWYRHNKACDKYLEGEKNYMTDNKVQLVGLSIRWLEKVYLKGDVESEILKREDQPWLKGSKRIPGVAKYIEARKRLVCSRNCQRTTVTGKVVRWQKMRQK